MRLLLIGGLSLGLAASGAAETSKVSKASGPIHARTCPTPALKQKPNAPAKSYKLTQLPRAEVYAAVYYSDGCPRRLVEAQGKVGR